MIIQWMPLGVWFRNNRGGSSVRARTEVCERKDGYSPDDNVLCNVGMIRVYWA